MQFEEKLFGDEIFYLCFMAYLLSCCWPHRGFVDYDFNCLEGHRGIMVGFVN